MKPDAVKPSSRTLCRHNRWGAKPAMYLASALFALAAMSANAAETSTWKGGAAGIWGAGYVDNWDVYPDKTRYAKFSSPSSEPITVTVDETIEAYGVVVSSGRKADLSFAGNGLLINYRNQLIPSGSPNVIDWNINVTNIDTSAVSIYGSNVFHKTMNCAGTYNFSVKGNGQVKLCDSAQLIGQHMALEAGTSFECLDSSVTALTKDLKCSPGSSLRVADNAVLGLRILTLPFSRTEGVNDEWTMEGGEIRAMNPASSGYYVYMPYTNATKTVSGTGTFYVYRFDFKDATNVIFRLNGPNMYARDGYSDGNATRNIMFEVGGGSTIGTYGGDPVFNSWTNKIVGAVTVDTMDYADKTTPRTIKMARFFDCNGTITVKGAGAFVINETITQPNLGITVKDSATLGQVEWGSAYALGDIVLEDSAKFDVPKYLGHKNTQNCVKSITMRDDTALTVPRYVQASGDVVLSGNASAVICNTGGDSGAALSCANLSLADDAHLSVTGTIAATSLTMSGNAHLAFTAGTAFEAGAEFGAGNWTMEIKIPSGYEAGIRPVVIGAGFEGDFADHVTLIGDTEGWSARTLDGSLILYKDAPPSGIEWIGKSTSSDSWSDAANWNGGNVPTSEDIVAFGGLDRLTPYNDSVGTVSGLVFRASAGPFTLSGADTLVLRASCGSRGNLTADNASIASHSSFDQTIESFVNFGGNSCGVVTDGGGALQLLGGFTATEDWRYFVVCGDVRVNGTCSVGILSFLNSSTATPSCLRVLSGANFTIRNQYIRGIVEQTSYIGRIVVEEGASMAIQNGNCVFWYGKLENVIDGTLAIQDGRIDNARIVAGPTEQYYTGKGTIYADSARSAWRNDNGVNHYINFGGTLKLYMNGDWYTATYKVQGSEGVVQNPNYPTLFRMKDGTTLGATKDWCYGPKDDAYEEIANTLTPDDRKSMMVGTVTVNTQNPTNDTAHTITFIDPLDASDANLVKAGAGTLVFNETAGYPSQVSNLTVNAGTVQFTGAAPTVGSLTVNAGSVQFAGAASPNVVDVTANGGEVRFDAVPTTFGDISVDSDATASFASAPELSGTLTIGSNGASFLVDGLASTMAWELLATADEIVGPENATKWESAGRRRFKIVEDDSGMKLYGCRGGGFTVIFR